MVLILIFEFFFCCWNYTFKPYFFWQRFLYLVEAWIHVCRRFENKKTKISYLMILVLLHKGCHFFGVRKHWPDMNYRWAAMCSPGFSCRWVKTYFWLSEQQTPLRHGYGEEYVISGHLLIGCKYTRMLICV